jgi:hypothetical protein
MPNWTAPADICAEVETLWKQGKLLATLLCARLVTEPVDRSPGQRADDSEGAKGLEFPYGLRFRGPRASELGSRYEDVRAWLKVLEAASRQHRGAGFDIGWQDINTRALGRNRIPTAISLPSIEDALALIGKQSEAEQALAVADMILSRYPGLTAWVMRKPHQVLSHADAWPRLLDVIGWMAGNPRPGVYARQIDVAGVDTKFVENHKTVLTELLDILLPREAIEGSATGVALFESRYGLKTKPAIIRFRLLDAKLAFGTLTDLAVPTDEFAALDLSVERVFIVENEITFLAFPPVSSGLVVFGGGYGVDRLATAAWIGTRHLYYWGDIDTHGFVILDRLRSYFPRSRALLMDRATLMAHEGHWSRELAPFVGNLERLNAEEHALFDDLRRDRLGAGVRLEQERVRFSYACAEILSDNQTKPSNHVALLRNGHFC